MANDKLIDTESRNKGPAIAGRNPVILPEQRKKAARKVRDALNL